MAKRLRFTSPNGVKKPDRSTDGDWIAITCGHCGNAISAAVVAIDSAHEYAGQAWVQCPSCCKGSVVFGDTPTVPGSEITVIPGHRSQPNISGLSDPVKRAYDEARDCFSVGAFTGCELLCRKIIMYVAVDKAGAPQGETFVKYLGELEASGYLTPAMKPWVDRIRQHGNAATHELDVPTENRAEGTLEFTALLLRLIYETEYKTGQFAAQANVPASTGAS